ncbi:MAG: flagellar biosynthetic protein FliO [Armatimonadota bacterium]
MLADLLSEMRDDPVTPITGGVGGLSVLSLVQMLAALAIVLLIVRLLVPRMLAKWKPSASSPGVGEELSVLSSLPVGAGAIHLIRVRDRTLLVGTSPSGVSLLTDFTEDVPDPVATPGGSPATFEEMLKRLERLRQ